MARQITQQELADKFGISRSSLSNIENGKYDIGLSLLCDISKALGTTPGELIVYKYKNSKNVQTLIIYICTSGLFLDYIKIYGRLI